MRKPKGVPCHDCAPEGWAHHTPNITGDYDLDETLMHRSNKDMQAKLSMYTRKIAHSGPKTAYNGYHGYNRND